MDRMRKMKVAILGSGNIGTDLLVKVLRSPCLECALFIGRNLSSPGMAKAASLGVPISDQEHRGHPGRPGLLRAGLRRHVGPGS